MAEVPDFGENSSRIHGPSVPGAQRDGQEEQMPLRARLLALVGLMLLASLAGGGALVTWHAAGRVQTELRAALLVGVSTVSNALHELASDDRATELRRLVATFDGNRHVRAMLLDAAGMSVAQSSLFVPVQKVPRWFVRLIGDQAGSMRIAAEDGTGILLQTDPTNELGEVWGESHDTMLVLAGFAALSAVLILAVVGHALRSLERFSAAFAQIGAGDHPSPLPVEGPPELKRLANGFNLMSERLAATAAQNQRLNERLLSLQSEERADLARDLHDEIGPLVFSIDMTAATVERLAAAGRAADVLAHARSIHDAVSQIQRRVRAILERLRPLGTTGLATAIERLVSFWQSRCPAIGFDVTLAIEEEQLEEDAKETIYRVVQEGLSNAIRHAAPNTIGIVVSTDAADGVRVVLTDDGVGPPARGTRARGPARFGLIGMRERVMAMAGSLAVGPGPDGKGLRLVATLPCTSLAPEVEQEPIP
jgi:two-component system sensor histidine kinase UhpB